MKSLTLTIFEKWKAQQGITSDAEGALRLGITRGTPHHWRNGGNGSVFAINKMCNDLGLDPTAAILEVLSHTGKTSADRAALRHLANKYRRTVGIAAITGL